MQARTTCRHVGCKRPCRETGPFVFVSRGRAENKNARVGGRFREFWRAIRDKFGHRRAGTSLSITKRYGFVAVTGAALPVSGSTNGMQRVVRAATTAASSRSLVPDDFTILTSPAYPSSLMCKRSTTSPCLPKLSADFGYQGAGSVHVT